MTTVTSFWDTTTIFLMQSGSNEVYTGNDTLYMAKFNTIGVPYSKFDIYNTTVGTYIPRIEAHECALWFCLQGQFDHNRDCGPVVFLADLNDIQLALDTSISNGLQNQTIIDEWNKTKYDPTGFGIYNFTDIPDKFNVTSDVLPAISYMASNTYSNLLNDMTGTVNTSIGTYSYTSDIMQGVWLSSDNLSSWIANLATSMSNNIRLTAPAPSNAYAGIAYSLTPYVRVRWEWLAFPFGLVLATVVFLGLTMRSTAQRSLEAWKSDPLPLLFVDVDEETRKLATGGMGKEDGIKDGLGEYQVRLISTGEQRWGFQSL